MKRCPYCNSENLDDATICQTCGSSLTNVAVSPMPSKNISSKSTSSSSSAVGWGFLGFFVPIAGLILFLVWRDDRPEDSKAAGIGALVSVIISVVFSTLFTIFYVLVAGGALAALFESFENAMSSASY